MKPIQKKEESTSLQFRLLKSFKFLKKLSQLEKFIIFFSISSAFLLYVFRISSLMTFVGDQGWFYMSAYRLITGTEFPLVGIASSHPWLHQGAFWTYLLAPALYLGQLHPLSGFIVSLFFGVLSLFAIFFVTRRLFDTRVALLSLILYSFSPLVILGVRMPYHTSPIPFFTLLYILSLHMIVKKERYAFPLSLACLAILYNFEIATALLVVPLGGLLAFGLIKKEVWLKQLLTFRSIFVGLIAFTVPMTPFLIYDLSHGFPQTFKFLAWVGYRFLLVFGFPPVNDKATPFLIGPYLQSEILHLQRLIFLPSQFLAIVIFFGALVFFLYILIAKKLYREYPYILFSLWLFTSLLSYVAMKTSSDAYLPIFLSAIIILFGLCLSHISSKFTLALILGTFIVANSYSLIGSEYFMNKKDGYGPSLEMRESAVRSVILSTKESRYTITGSGEGSQFASFTTNYSFLGIWLNRPPSNEGKKFLFSETYDKVIVREELDQ